MGRNKKPLAADDWARKYFKEEIINIENSEELELILEKEGLKPRKALIGLPEDFPRPLVNSNSWLNKSEWMNAAQNAYEQGYGLALLRALKFHCMLHRDSPLPKWITQALICGISMFDSYETVTLEQSFAIKRKRRKKIEANFRATWGGMILVAIKNAEKSNVAIGDELFESIARHFIKKNGSPISGSTIKRIYGENNTGTKSLICELDYTVLNA